MPGMGTPELPVPDGLVLRPFRGVRFTVEDPAKVTSPPYDLISDADVERLLDSHPNNVVRLILPRSPRRNAPTSSSTAADAPPQDRYAEARDTLRTWLSSGVLAPDAEPALYVYEQKGPGVVQRGLIGDVGLADPTQAIVLPHEDVLPGPIADRLALMSTTQANLEPIFLLYDGGDGATTRLVDAVADERSPLVSARTEDGLTHRLWAITDPSEIAAINADLHHRQALIADGHHRYATYRVLQRQEHLSRRPNAEAQAEAAQTEAAHDEAALGAAGSGAGSAAGQRSSGDGGRSRPAFGPWDFGLALLVDSSAYPPDLKAIHRVIPSLPLEDAVAKAKGAWRVHDHPEIAEGVAALERTQGPAFLLAGEGGAHLLTDPDPMQLARAMPADHSDRWNSLNTSILTSFVLPIVWGLRDDEQTVRIVHHDIDAAVRLARQMGGTAVILKPLAVEDVLAVAAGGERVPRKSTSFGPKPRTGLVLRTFDID
ncbi:DUF1015 family protein [Nonomuraea maritima]|uniref:DUF1015 family protein n=1 Tax=Nonomuraea maritima TaxID=683260 RepID=UPI003718BBB3